MNQRTAKLLNRVARETNQSPRDLKRMWKSMSDRERAHYRKRHSALPSRDGEKPQED